MSGPITLLSMMEFWASVILPAWAAFIPSWVVTLWENQGRSPPVNHWRELSRAPASDVDGVRMVTIRPVVTVTPPPVALIVTG